MYIRRDNSSISGLNLRPGITWLNIELEFREFVKTQHTHNKTQFAVLEPEIGAINAFYKNTNC